MDDRFAPPLSEVEDPTPSRPLAPGRVLLATRLLWTSLVLALPSSLYDVGRSPGGQLAVSIAVQLAIFALAAFINLSIYRGRNWARILSLVFTAIEVGAIAFGPDIAEETAIEAVCKWAAVALDVTAMYLLFTRSAPAWFKRNERLASHH